VAEAAGSDFHGAAAVNDHPSSSRCWPTWLAARPGGARELTGAAEARRRRRGITGLAGRTARSSSRASAPSSRSHAPPRRATGLGGTIRHERAGGFLVEAGPDPSCPRSRGRSSSAGVSASRIGSSAPTTGSGSFVWRAGRLTRCRRVPASGADRSSGVVRSGPLLVAGKLRIGPRPCPARGVSDDESLGASCGAGSVAKRSSGSPGRWSPGSTRPIPTISRWPRRCRLRRARAARAVDHPGTLAGQPQGADVGTSGARWTLVTFANGMEELVSRWRHVCDARCSTSTAWTESSARFVAGVSSAA